MESLNFGKLTISQTDAGVEIDSHGAAVLKNADIPLLLEFLKQYLSEYADLRSSWRLDVGQLKDTPAEALRVSVSGKHASAHTTVLDISLTGIFLQSDKPLGERISADGDLSPPKAYRAIFYALEQIWLDKQLGLQWN